jgi:hypothetical protein
MAKMEKGILSRFWRWWTGELASFLPHIDPRRDVNSLSSHELNIGPDGAVLYRGQRLRNPLKTSQEITRQTDVLGVLPHVVSIKQLVLTFDVASCMVRSVSVPHVALDRVEDALQLQLATLNPFPHKNAISFSKFESTTGETSLFSHAILRPEIVQRATEMLRDAGVTPVAIGLRDGANAAWPTVRDLAGNRFGLHRESLWKKRVLVSSLCLAATTLIAGTILGYRQQAARLELETAIAEIEPTALKVRKSLDAAAKDQGLLSALMDLRRNRLSSLTTLNALTQALPDHKK